MKTNEEIIEEAINEWQLLEQNILSDSDFEHEIKKLAKEKAKELPQPVQSPSEWIVEVDGHKKGKFRGYNRRWRNGRRKDGEGEYHVGTARGHSNPIYYKLSDHHIRLLTKEGCCVMDNRKTTNQ